MNLRSIRLRSVVRYLSLLAALALAQPLTGQEGLFDEPLVTGEPGADTADPLTEGADPLAEGATPQVDPREEYMRRLAEAEALMEQQKWSEAVNALNELLAVGRHPRALLDQGISFRELGANDLAINSLSMATIAPGAAAEPGLVERALLTRGELYSEMGRYREAVDDFMQAAAQNPANPEPHYQQGRAMLRLVATSPGGGMDQSGQASLIQAAKSLEQAISLRSDYGEAYLERGRALFRLRQMDLAIADFQQAVRHLGPTSAAAAELGVAYSVRASQEAYRPSPDSAQLVQSLREALGSLSDNLRDAQLGEKTPPWETVDPFELQTRPENVMLSRGDTQIALGHELTGNERTEAYRAALADADRLLASDLDEPTEGQAHYLRGSALRLLGDLDGAVDAFSNAIRILEGVGRSATDAYLRRGICFYYQDKMDVALQDFEAASTVPNNPYIYEPRAMMWAGIAHARRGDFDEAIRNYTRSVAAAPRYTAAYLNRGLAYMNMGRYDMALEDFDTILRQHPNHSAAQRYRDIASRQR